MKNKMIPSPKSIWMVTKKVFVSAAIIPALTLSSMSMAFTPVAYALEEGVCLPGTTETITLVSGEDTQTAGYTEINPVAAPASFAPALYDGVTFGNADITNSAPVTPPWVDPALEGDLTDAEWISTNTSNSEGTATSDQWRLFTDSFELPAGAVIEGADLWYTADNAAAVYLNGGVSDIDNTGDDVYGATPASPAMTFSEVFDTSLNASDLVVGENTLSFIVRNWSAQADTNPTGLIYKAVIDYCVPPVPTSVNVTIVKYIDGVMATDALASSADFPMSATWDAENIGAGTGEYALSESGFGGDETPYQAMTAEMTPGADYSTNEILTGDVVGASCEESKPFALTGYKVGNSLAEAESSASSMTIPAFVNLTENKTVIVLNTDCSDPVPPVPTEDVRVTIHKFIQGAQATGASADNASFPMSATWDAENIGAGTGGYTLDSVSEAPYQAMTVLMDAGADYSTNEVLTGDVVGASCTEDKPFALTGYSTGDSYAQAVSGAQSLSIPTFVNLQNDKYVIVWNHDCSITDGEIGGDVEGNNGVLAVTSIESVDTSAIANGSFGDGWEYIFHITAPTTEQDLAMKFSNWSRTGGGGTILTANNVRISSAQANNGGATILLTAADTYSVPALHMTGDLNAVMDGRQVEVSVEVAVPVGTPSGSYTTSYGVTTN